MKSIQGIPTELVRQSESFIGREWAMAEIAAWHETDEPLLVVTGEPGVGKSTLMTRLVQISLGHVVSRRGLGPGWLHAWHFCQAQRFSSLDIRGVLERVAGQLCATLPGYAEAVAYRVSGTTVTVNQQFAGSVRDSTVTGIQNLVLPEVEPQSLLDSLFRKPLSDLGAHVVLLLDAVDETEERVGGPQTLARLLGELHTDPVPGLRLVLTARSGPSAERFSPGRQLRLREDEPEGTDDVLSYLRGRLHDRGIAEPTRVAQLIAHAADGNFLYAALAAAEDSEGLRLLASGKRVLPQGLANLYGGFLDRQVTADPGRWRNVVRPVLGLLVQSRESGFTRRQLAQLSGLRQSAVDDALALCAPYLRGLRPDGPFLPFHGSLRDYLRSESRHGIYPEESTERIIGAFRVDATDPHGIEHLLGYMADRIRLIAPGAGGEKAADIDGKALQALRELEETVSDCRYLSARIAATGVDSLLNEMSALHDLLPENPVLGSLCGVIGRQAHNLRGGVMERSTQFTAQQLLYECLVSGNSGLLRCRDTGDEPVIAALWNAASENSRLLSHTLATGDYCVDALVISEGGTRTALSGYTWSGNDMQKTVRVFDTETGSVIREFSLIENRMKVFSLRFTDDDRELVALRVDGTGVIWDLSSGTEKSLSHSALTQAPPSFQPMELPPYALPQQVGPLDLNDVVVAATPDRRYAAVCAEPGEPVIVWDLVRHIVLGRYDADFVRSLAISPDGRWVVVGSVCGGADVLSPLSPAPRLSLDGHRGTVRAASLCGSRAVTLGRDGDLKIWDVARGGLLRTIGAPLEQDRIEAIALDAKADLCVVGTGGGNATLLDLRHPSRTSPLMVCGAPCDANWKIRDGVRDEALPPVGAGDCPRELWPTQVNDRHGSPLSALDISSDRRRIATGTLNGVVRVWDADTGDLVREVTRGGHLVRAVRFTPDGNHLVTVAQLGGMYLPQWLGVEKWSLDTGELTEVVWPDETHGTFPLPADDSVAALTRDGRYLVTGHPSGRVTVHDLVARERVGCLVLHGAITCLAFDGLRLLAGTANGDVTLSEAEVVCTSAGG